jgi:hypothetical protein
MFATINIAPARRRRKQETPKKRRSHTQQPKKCIPEKDEQEDEKWRENLN